MHPTRREIVLAGAVAMLARGCHTRGTEDGMASTESEIKSLLESRSEATRLKDIDRLMLVYAPDIVYFDVVPPLKYAGAAALRSRFLEWFESWQGSIGQEIRDLNVVASGDLAAAHMLVRASGTKKNGREVGYWVRATDFCRRSDRRWLITHEHISLPVDFQSGSVVMNLVP